MKFEVTCRKGSEVERQTRVVSEKELMDKDPSLLAEYLESKLQCKESYS